MPVTKITLSTAMRARDVSRPREEQLAEAAEHEDTIVRTAEVEGEVAPAAEPPATTADVDPDDAAEALAPTRRRRRRSR